MQRNLLLLACSFVSVNSIAQQFPFVFYTPNDGLVNSRVRSIKQDGKGRMYFISYGGLSVYDGARFTNYNQETGLANEVVNDVVEITPDSLLVATNINKLNTLVRGKVGVFQTSDGFCPVINRLYKSKDRNWYACADDGLYLLKEKKFIKLNLKKSGIDVGQCMDKIVEWNGYFLLVPWNSQLANKMLLYDIKKNRLEYVYKQQNVTGIGTDLNNVVWIITSSGIFNPDPYKLKQGELMLLPALQSPPLATQGNCNLYFDPLGNGWVFGNNRIQKMTAPFTFLSAEQGLKATSLSDLFVDREGMLWMASDGHGVAKLKNPNFQLLNSIGSNPQIACTAIEVKDNIAWFFSSSTNSVYCITKTDTSIFPFKKGTVATLRVNQSNLYFSNDKSISSINQNRKATAYLNPETIFLDTPLGLGTGVIDANGVLIQLVQKKEDDYYVYALKDKKIIGRHKISFLSDQLHIDKGGRLWIATRNNHLMLFTLHPDDPENYLRLVKDFSPIADDISPRSVTVDKQNRVWIGTRYHGLYQYKLNGSDIELMKHYTTRDGLTDNFICRLASDEQNNIWIGTQTGLDKLLEKDGAAVIANIGKNNHVFQRIVDIKIAEDGTAWALNQDGTVLKVSPGQFSPLATPLLLLSSIKTGNENIDTGLHQFSYRQNSFSVNIAAPSFVDEKNIRYSYLLEGSGNHAWSEPSHQTSFSFVNLSAGDYKLFIRADFPEAIYPSQTTSYPFTVLPPWWQTWWFRMTLGFLVVGLMIWLVRFYYRRKLDAKVRLLEKQQAIEKERTRIATDMHDDLGAGLSRIKFLSETIGIKKQQEKPIEEDIGKIREYSHQMIDKMGEIVWALNEKNDSLTDLLSFTRAYSVEYLSQNGIICQVTMPDDVKDEFIRGEFRRNIFLSVKEVLHNIVKHAEANYVQINIEAGKNLVLRIQDDGKGFDSKNIRPFSNGLSNIEKRMKDIGGSSEIKNGQGTMVKLIAPLPRD